MSVTIKWLNPEVPSSRKRGPTVREWKAYTYNPLGKIIKYSRLDVALTDLLFESSSFSGIISLHLRYSRLDGIRSCK